MNTTYWRYLQLFAEGGEGSTGEGEGSAATVEASKGDDGQQRLRAMGVPERYLQKQNARRSRAAVTVAAPQETRQKDQQGSVPPAQEEHPVEDHAQEETAPQEGVPKLADLAKKYPSINQEMQSIVQNRLKGKRGSDQALKQLAPLLSMVAGGYGVEIDSENPDYRPLVDAYMHDPERYQDLALEKGITSQQAMDDTLAAMRQQEWDDHFNVLQQQAQDFRKVVPDFDLRAEMQNNPVFARITAPGCLSVEDAYTAMHWKEMQAATAEATARKTREQMSAAIRSGSKRPRESGSTSQSASTTTFNYAHASPEQRAAFKQQLRAAWARGETVYPTR